MSGPDSQGRSIVVTCYSGFKGDERPIRFRLGDTDYLVEEVIDQWYGPDSEFFRVKADDGGIYVLRHNRGVGDGGEWGLEPRRTHAVEAVSDIALATPK